MFKHKAYRANKSIRSNKEYVPPVQMRINQERASSHQPRLWTPHGVGNHYERSQEHKNWG